MSRYTLCCRGAFDALENTGMSRTAGRLAMALIATGTLLSPAFGEGFSTWDTFDGATEIDAHRWSGSERTRVIEGGQLRFLQRDFGNQTGDAGVFNNSWVSYLPNAAAITRIRSVITVNDYTVSGCAKNATPSFVAARVGGEFFDAGSGAPTSRVDDVGAVIQLVRISNSGDAAGVLRVGGVAYRCTRTDCNYDSAILGSVDLGTAAVGEPVQLRVDWDQAKQRFGFARGSDPAVYVTYTASGSQPAFTALRFAGTRTSIANCFTGPRTEGFIDARYDKVYLNISAVP